MSARILLALAAAALPALAQQASSASLTINADQPGPQVNRQLFGQFAEHLGAGIYGGIWVGEDSKIPNTRGYRNDVLQALRDLKVPVVRWPGGCFADEYHWREGVGPRSKRPVKINTHWGGVTEPNTFGTHEFMDFAELLGAEAYISGNVGSASPREMAEWVEYVTSPAGSLASERAANGRQAPWKLPYFGLGNELWGCGGNMRAEYAADVTRRYSTFVKVPAGVRILKSASGPSDEDYHWMEVMMRDAGSRFDAIGLHYYTITHNWQHKGSATTFDEAEYAKTLATTIRIDDIITQAFRDHGQVRPTQARRAGAGRVGHVVGRRAGHQSRLPVPAEHAARRAGGGAQPQHLRQARRPAEAGEHRADGQRAAGHDPDRRTRRWS